MTLYKCQHCHAINAPDAPGDHLLFCRTCSGPVVVVSDELPFENEKTLEQMLDDVISPHTYDPNWEVKFDLSRSKKCDN